MMQRRHRDNGDIDPATSTRHIDPATSTSPIHCDIINGYITV
jgi:hypothetical protein